MIATASSITTRMIVEVAYGPFQPLLARHNLH